MESEPQEPTRTPKWKGNPPWVEALGRAIEREPLADGPTLFQEERQDLSVELDGRTGRPAVDGSRTSGLAYTDGQGHGQFRADPCLDDAELLVRSELPAVSPSPPPSPEEAPWLPCGEAVTLLEEVLTATLALHPGGEPRTRWVAFEQRIHVARPGRSVVTDLRRGRRIRLELDLARGGRTAHAVGEAVLRPDTQNPGKTTLDELSRSVAERAEARLGAEPLAAGARRVVFAPGVGGILLHELVGHALEADTVLGGASWLAGGAADGYRGSPELRVLDDPRRGRAAWRFDDEGEPARATPLVREGRVVGGLHDLSSARRSGAAPTGHGRRSGFRDPVRPRMGCTFLAAGRHDPEEALHDVEEGVYVRRMEAASTDTRTGHATFRVTDADRIRNGRRIAPLAAHVLHVDAMRALSSVERVASDLAFDTCVGSCLHHGQPLSISVGGPTFRIASMTLFF